MTMPTPNALIEAAAEVALIEKAALKVGMTSMLNHGAASCVYSEGCDGVSQEHLVAFTREIALHCAVALASPAPGWRPIETAPKDRTLIVLGSRSGVWLGKYLPVYSSGYRPENPWTSMLLNHDHMAERYTQPTHWQPLPPPPHPEAP